MGRLYAFAKIVDPSPSFENYAYINGDLIIKNTGILRIKPNAIDSEKIEWHAIQAEDLDTSSITSRTIKDGTIQGEDISTKADLEIRSLAVSGAVVINGASTITGNLNMQNNQILNIGNAGTDFTNTGGLTLAGNLMVNGAGTNYFAGNVGIGTTTPGAILDISSMANSSIRLISTAGVPQLTLIDAATSNQTLVDFREGSGDGTVDGRVGVFSSTNAFLPAQFYFQNRIDNSGYFVFNTKTSTVLTERMRITNAGNVGIGNTAPDSQLQVGVQTADTNLKYRGLILQGGYATTSGVRQQNLMTFGSIGAGFFNADPFLDTAVGNDRNWHIGSVSDSGYFQNNRFSFIQKGIEQMVIKNGNVGIGTTNPSSTLTVAGEGSFYDLITRTTPVYDVRAYGSLQAAIDAASAAGGGTVQPAPNTTYTGAITLKADVTLRCVDRSTIITIANATDWTDVITVTGSNTAIINCTIDGNGTNQSTFSRGINSSSDINNFLVDNIELRNTHDDGISMGGATGAISNITISNSYIHDAGTYGVNSRGVTNLKIQNNLVRAFAVRTTTADAFFLQSGAGGSINTNVSITDNVVQNTVSSYFGIESAPIESGQIVNGCTISNNTWDAGGLNASGISGSFYNCSMTGNAHLNGAGGHRSGYEIVGTGNTISGNTILNGTIVIGGFNFASGHVVVSGNYIRNDGAISGGVIDASGVMIGGGTIAITDVTITGNEIHLTNANPQSGIFLGVFGTKQQINRVKVTGNKVYCSSGGRNGIQLLASAGTSDVDVEENTITGCGNGWLDDSSAGNYTDISLINNDLHGNTTAILHNFTGGSWRSWGNITTAGQTTQNLNGGATVSSTGIGTFNGGLQITGGNVGIGTTTVGSRLVIKGSGATSATSSLNITDSNNVSRVFVRDDGNVGIGTTTPGYKLDVNGNEMVSGYLRLGSNYSASTAGDLSAIRLFINGSTGGTFATLSGTLTDTAAGAVIGTNILSTISPLSDSASQFRSFNINNIFNTASNFSGISSAGNFENRITNAGTINTLNGINANGIVVAAAAASLGTVTTVNAIYALPVSSFSNALTSTISNVFGLHVVNSSNGGTGPLTITNQVGVGIDALVAGTNNTALLIGTTTAPLGNFGIYNASTNNNYFAGNVGIGDTSPDTTLKVVGSICARADGNNCTAAAAGSIYAANFIAEGGAHLPDYVFEPNYEFLSISDLKNYIALNKHLPGVPSASEVNRDGLNLGLMVPAILEKTEENTLYIIDNYNQIKEQKNQISGITDNQNKIVEQLTGQLTVELADQERSVDSKIQLIGASLDKLSTQQIATLNEQILAQTKDITDLEKQMADIKSAMYVERYDELWKFYLVFKPESLANVVFKENGNINLLEGKITAKDIEALNTIKAKDIEATNNLKGDNLELGKSTRGKGVIKSGEAEVKIETPFAATDAQIYLTPLSKLDGGSLYVDMENVKEGENFTVKLDGNNSDKDIEFNWLIIQ